MNPPTEPNAQEIARRYIKDNIGPGYHSNRLEKIECLKLRDLIARKNPYLFRTKGFTSAEELISSLFLAWRSSSEETDFGKFMERLAIHVCSEIYNGREFPVENLDLVFDKEGKTYLVTIKSGPNWGNADQIKKMKEGFQTAYHKMSATGEKKRKENIISVEGCCYGSSIKKDESEYSRYCGQRFWELISGDEELYKSIIEYMGHDAEEWEAKIQEAGKEKVQQLAGEFEKKFCNSSGEIDWESWAVRNSGTKKKGAKKKTAKKKGAS